MDMENPSSRMTALGKDMLLFGEVKEIDEIVKTIDSVTKSDVQEMANFVFNGKKARGILLPVNK